MEHVDSRLLIEAVHKLAVYARCVPDILPNTEDSVTEPCPPVS